jgi:glycosyltransferase involved in cell wall biosynthesis
MILFDTTSASGWRHASGLSRVSHRLREELSGDAVAAAWPEIVRRAGRDDWILSPELFSEAERPGIGEFLASRRCRTAAIYHDSIPMKLPEVTWPASVERHPGYVKLLSRFDRVWAVSEASRRELVGLWNWQAVEEPPPVGVLPLGADWRGIGRARGPWAQAGPVSRIVSVGILEPRKNQLLLMEAAAELWEEGLSFELHLAGRVNPHFGGPIVRRLLEIGRKWPCLRHHVGLGDAELAALVSASRATAFPSAAEGCGLPVLESLWLGTPCVCSAIAPVLETASGGGCLVVQDPGRTPWKEALRAVLADDALHGRLCREARERDLPAWSGAARILRSELLGR